MQIRHLILASLLPVAFGCPAGDDTTDTDAHDTEPANTSSTTDNTTPGTTTDDTTPATSTSTTGMDGSSTSMAEESTGTPGTTTTGMETTGAAMDCAAFCTTYLAVCGESADNDYGDQAGCEDACAGYDAATYECKEYHASMADGAGSVHCGHANVDGGGVC